MIAYGKSALLVGVLSVPVAAVLFALSSVHQSVAPMAETPEDVANLLDSVIQPRFQRFDDGLFGAERIPPITFQHETVRSGRPTLDEQKVLNAANSAGREYAIAFLGLGKPAATAYRDSKGVLVHSTSTARTVPTNPAFDKHIRVMRSNRPSSSTGRRDYVWEKSIESYLATVDEKTLIKAKRGKPVEASNDSWCVALRPIRALKVECLNCHTQSKPGDTLGILFYAISKQVNKQTAQKSAAVTLGRRTN